MTRDNATSLHGDEVWQHALSTARIGVIERNFVTGETRHSPSWKRMLGYKQHEFADHVDLWHSLIHPDDAETVRKVSRLCVIGETSGMEAEFRLRHRSGEFRWFLGRGCVVERDKNSRAVRMISLQTDITDQKHAEHALQNTNERLRLALNASGVGIWQFEPDTDRLVWDERVREIYGLGPGSPEVPRETWLERLHPEDRPKLEELDKVIMTGGGATGDGPAELRYRVITPEGETRHVMVLMKMSEDANRSKRLVGTNRDITSEVLAAEALATEKETLRVTLHSIRDAVMATSADGAITYANEAAVRLFGCSEADMIGRPIAVWLSRRCARRLDEQNDVLLAMDGPGGERVIRHTAAPIVTGTGLASGSVHTFQDVTEEQARKRELAHAARHDSLTGVLNRGAFLDRLAEAIARAEKKPFALFYIDLDYFKAINDMAGHAAGDAALKGVTAALERSLPAGSAIGRLGGDEFAAIVMADEAAACGIAEGALDAIRATALPPDIRHRNLGASIGIEFVAHRDGSPTDVLAWADDACYAAKAGGRNRVALREHRAESSASLAAVRMASDIADAMDDGRLKIFGQELRDLSDPWKSIGIVEVLARLVDANGREIPPSEFIPAAERFGMASMLDRWVIKRALDRHGSVMGENGSITLGFNLSAQTLSDPSLWDHVEETIRSNGVAPDHVVFEITETAAVTNFEAAQRFVERARSCGCRVSLDDFGTGLSSFSYLRRFTVDSVKIDGDFIENIARNPFDRAIVSSISGIARDLGFYVIAERIEDPDALPVLRGLGVRLVQGYLLHRPEPLEHLIERICFVQGTTMRIAG